MTLALIGFGEAGQAFAKGWRDCGIPVARAFDLCGIPDDSGITGGDRATVLDNADTVFCLVTADQALAAAAECVPHLSPGVFWFDGNSCAPGTKRKSADVIEAAGGHYIDCAIMAPVHPRLHATPVLLSGPKAGPAAERLAGLAMNARVVGPAVGSASAIKMMRSIMIKGLEALHAECFLAARKAGVETEVMASLMASDPGMDWPARAAYNLERMTRHGIRRAAEMREVVLTLNELGLPGDLTASVADWHQRIGELDLDEPEGALWTRMDTVLQRL